jgi:hypothetical protein
VGRFVLRQRTREWPRPGVDPLREVACHRAAAAAGVAPAVRDAAPDGSWIVMDLRRGRDVDSAPAAGPRGPAQPGCLPPAPSRDDAPQGPRGV